MENTRRGSEEEGGVGGGWVQEDERCTPVFQRALRSDSSFWALDLRVWEQGMARIREGR
jgi:hypothetical protein